MAKRDRQHPMFTLAILARQISSKGALVAGAIASTLSFGVLIAVHSEHWQIYLVTALPGVGVGLAFAALGNLIVQAVPARQTGVATGMNTVMGTVGGAVGNQIAATLLAENLRATRRSDFEPGQLHPQTD